MARRIYENTVIKWITGLGLPVSFIAGLFAYLAFTGAIEITGHSGDNFCSGTVDNPCIAYINFTANEDVFIYPLGYDPWERDQVAIQFEPRVKSWKLQRSWGDGWRTIYLNQTCIPFFRYCSPISASFPQ